MKSIHFLHILIILIYLLNQINSEEISISLNDISTDTENENYSIVSKVLTLSATNNYKITGECTECSIIASVDMSITLSNINLINSNTGPFIISKSAKVNLILEGESTIIDNEDITKEDEKGFEGAGIKFKASSTLTISGVGKLNIQGNAKNGIKGAKKSKLIINSGTLNISSKKNALACDNIITINDGTINIISESDGIKSEPDSDDDDSKGNIIINGGNINIDSQSDAIQAAYKLEINGGVFNIKTYEGAYSKNFNKDEMSAKGLKCSTNEHPNATNEIIINGGEFHLNTSDDAVHSDYNITITKGNFEIITGDDGIHADQYLFLGEQDQKDDSLLNIKILKSYEGLEGSQVYIFSGTYNIISSDDGINAAGDTDANCQGGGPGGNGGMGPGGNGGKRPSFRRNLQNPPMNNMNSQCLIFHIYILGGNIYVNTESDGLDANGNIYIEGGNLEVWGMKTGGDGDPIDLDGNLYITGGTVLAGGSQGMKPVHNSAKTISQNFIYSTNNFQANKVITIKSGDEIIKTITIPKQINYLFFTSNDTNSNYKFSEGSTTYNDGSSEISENTQEKQGEQGQPGNQGPPGNGNGRNPSDSSALTGEDEVENNCRFLFYNLMVIYVLGLIML